MRPPTPKNVIVKQFKRQQSSATENVVSKPLTVQKPFDLQTAKRMRAQFQLDEDDELDEESVRNGQTNCKRRNLGEYEPLTSQLKRSFQLRTQEKLPDRKRNLTKPTSPNF